MAADCLNIADDNSRDKRILEDGREVVDSDVVQRAKLRIETRLKLLACWDPKRYGNKIDHTTGGNPIPAPEVTDANSQAINADETTNPLGRIAHHKPTQISLIHCR